MTRPEDYIQRVVRPGSWSPAGFVTCLVLILVDIYFVRHQNSSRDNFARITSDPQTSRRIFAAAYMTAAIFSATVVMYYQDEYFTDVHKPSLRDKREVPQSKYPWFYELVLSQHLIHVLVLLTHVQGTFGSYAADVPDDASSILGWRSFYSQARVGIFSVVVAAILWGLDQLCLLPSDSM